MGRRDESAPLLGAAGLGRRRRVLRRWTDASHPPSARRTTLPERGGAAAPRRAHRRGGGGGVAGEPGPDRPGSVRDGGGAARSAEDGDAGAPGGLPAGG